MQHETLIAIIATLVFALVLRPKTVVVVQNDRDESSGFASLFMICMVAGGIWLLSQEGCEFPSFPVTEEPETQKAAGEMIFNKTHENRDGKTPDAIINSEPNPHRDDGTMKSSYRILGDKSPEKPQPKWVLFLKEYPTEAAVQALSNYFSTRNIKAVERTDGTYWAVIYALQNEKEAAKLEAADWKRHQTDWEKHQLSPKVLNLNDP
jgi:hypothetical protein